MSIENYRETLQKSLIYTKNPLEGIFRYRGLSNFDLEAEVPKELVPEPYLLPLSSKFTIPYILRLLVINAVFTVSPG